MQGILIYIIDNVLRLLHPFIPFITEELWQMIKPFIKSDKDSILETSYPTKIDIKYDELYDPVIALYYKIIYKIRRIRNSFRVKNTIDIVIINRRMGKIRRCSPILEFIYENRTHIQKLTRGRIHHIINKDDKYIKYTMGKETICIKVTKEFDMSGRINTLKRKLKKLLKTENKERMMLQDELDMLHSLVHA